MEATNGVQPATEDLKLPLSNVEALISDSTPLINTECCKSNGIIESNVATDTLNAMGPEVNSLQTHDADDSISESQSSHHDDGTDKEDKCKPEVNLSTDTLDMNMNTDNKHSDDKHILNNEKSDEVVIETSMQETHPTLNSVAFETEILIETNVNDKNMENVTVIEQTENILNDISENIKLSEALKSSDMNEQLDNSNGTSKQQIFNKEELIDILEGNDETVKSCEENKVSESPLSVLNAEYEKKLALQQLSRLKQKREVVTPKRKTVFKKHIKSEKKLTVLSETKDIENKEQSLVSGDKQENVENTVLEKPSIVNTLVQDWDDEDPVEEESVCETNEVSVANLDSTNVKEINSINKPTVDSSIADTHDNDLKTDSINKKNVNETTEQKRRSRIIKKKVIFDPDNPDTFTKGKSPNKPKQFKSHKEQLINKTNLGQTSPNFKSKPHKMQWRKPSAKHSLKQGKRLSEVDRLLMDEGAVNMIYQLTPEATKGKKNTKTKAEFIKKLQSSTPENEMKFRERKKEVIRDEAKKIFSGKSRNSISSSIKSPSQSVCEDFETHSADDSIIYRRHSSSSYSSSCMSPRGLSEIDCGISSSKLTNIHDAKLENDNLKKDGTAIQDVFMSEVIDSVNEEVIKKSDCLNIKEKLNSKLSQALKKRKRAIAPDDKSAKQNKILKQEEQGSEKCITENKLKFITVSYSNRLAEIMVKNTDVKNNLKVLKELNCALQLVERKENISTTLLLSECESLCPKIDLKTLFLENLEKRTNNAFEVAEAIRCVLISIETHSKLLLTGVWGSCSGPSLGLVTMCDIVLAGENSTFAVNSASCPLPGFIATIAHHQQWPKALMTELLVLERTLDTAEAVTRGLVSRSLWPQKVWEQARSIAASIAAQPLQLVNLKKQLMRMNRSTEAESTFQSCLERERDMLVTYWTSEEGQESLRASLDTA